VRAVDEGAVYEGIYLVEAVSEDGYTHRDRDGWRYGYVECKPHPLEPEVCVYQPRDHVCKYDAANSCRSSVSEPLDLLALYTCGTMQTHKQRGDYREVQNWKQV
jgi:hypothetical protein